MTDDELKHLIEGSAAETRWQVRQENADTRRHFDVAVEEFKSQVQLIAENVLSTGERLDRRFDDLASRMNNEFGEVKA